MNSGQGDNNLVPFFGSKVTKSPEKSAEDGCKWAVEKNIAAKLAHFRFRPLSLSLFHLAAFCICFYSYSLNDFTSQQIIIIQRRDEGSRRKPKITVNYLVPITDNGEARLLGLIDYCDPLRRCAPPLARSRDTQTPRHQAT